MAAMGSMAMGGPLPQPPMDPAMMGMPPAPAGAPGMGMPMDPAMMEPQVVPPPTATPLNGAGASNGTAVDLGGMGSPPVMAPDNDDLIMSALQAVLGKWASGGSVIAGEKNELLQTLMQLAATQPPMAPEAFVEGGIPTNFGMQPEELDNPMSPNGPSF